MSTFNIDPFPEVRRYHKQKEKAEKDAKRKAVKHVVIVGAGAAGMVCQGSSSHS